MPRGQGGAVESSLVLGEVLTAVVTPFDASGAVDHDRFRELAGYLVDNGSDGLVVAGTTGEAPTLSDDERLALISTAVEAVGDRATVTHSSSDALAEIAASRIDAILATGVPPERLALVPDCGFSQTARWAAIAKLRGLVAGRDLVRSRTPTAR